MQLPFERPYPLQVTRLKDKILTPTMPKYDILQSKRRLIRSAGVYAPNEAKTFLWSAWPEWMPFFLNMLLCKGEFYETYLARCLL